MKRAGEDNLCIVNLKKVSTEESAVPKVLREGDHNTDIIFTVEGRKLHFSKTLLSMCSPIFHTLLTLRYIKQHSEGIPLPGKKYSTMAFFLQLIHPVYSATPLTDDKLLETLALAKEYQVAHISTKCEQYIDSQLQLNQYNKMLTTDAILTYLTACEQHSMVAHRAKLVNLAAQKTTQELQGSKFFEPVPLTALKDVFLVRCQILERKLNPRSSIFDVY